MTTIVASADRPNAAIQVTAESIAIRGAGESHCVGACIL